MTTLIIGAVVAIVAAFVLTLVDAAIGSASRVAAEEADSAGRRGAPALRQILVPAPKTAPVGGRPLRDREILEWAGGLLREVMLTDLAKAG